MHTLSLKYPTPLLCQPFRLLFMAASLCASLDMLLWALFLHLGWLPDMSLPVLLWHGHEMLFGFAGALIAGFLLTAVAEWTKRPTVTPLTLLLLVTVWLVARIGFLLPTFIPYTLTAILDSTFFLLLAIMVAIPILRARNYRNLFVIPLLITFTLADVLFHLGVTGRLPLAPYQVLVWVIDLLTLLMLVIGGRVIPFFTSRRLAGVKVQHWRPLDWSVNGGGLVLLLVDIIVPSSRLLGGLSLIVAVLAMIRLAAWRPWRTLREPMLWVLHLGYLWLAVGIALRGVALLSGSFAEITALHALTVGALGSLSIGMMTRVPLGHTGRPISAGPVMTIVFFLPTLAAVLRLMNLPGWLPLAASLWTLAFASYFLRFLPVHFGPLRVNSTMPQ
ncbi:MAG: NnrS family protein [Gammaproteobacteria bacterium]